MKRELAEKQELLVSASWVFLHTTKHILVQQSKNTNLIRFFFSLFFFRKALESLAGREPGDHHHLREQAQKDMAALREAFNQRITDLEQVSRSVVFANFCFTWFAVFVVLQWFANFILYINKMCILPPLKVHLVILSVFIHCLFVFLFFSLCEQPKRKLKRWQLLLSKRSVKT